MNNTESTKPSSSQGGLVHAPVPAERVSLMHISHVHRGGGKFERPDNTLETFLWCWRNGSALECDCRRTRDGVGIMLHDATLRRTARGISEELASMDVSTQLDWNSIKDIDVGSYLSPEFSHHRIPTIDEVFGAMKGHPTWLCMVDEKGIGPAEIARKAVEAGVQDQVYYTGQDYSKAVEWTRILPGGKTLLWIGTWRPSKPARRPRPPGRCPPLTTTRRTLRDSRRISRKSCRKSEPAASREFQPSRFTRIATRTLPRNSFRAHPTSNLS